MNTRFVFVGNRRFVLQEMIARGLDLVAIIVMENTHLHRDLENESINGIGSYSIVNSKLELVNLLSSLKFDVLVSNGCHFILPIKDLPAASYVNIHPSCLPDLRGIDPVIGSILHARDGGATCHVMDEGIDTGEIISQIRIPYSSDLDVVTLYQLSFIAEKLAFCEALSQDFEAKFKQQENDDCIEYARSPNDWKISFTESNDELLRKVKAFNNRSQGCEFWVDGLRFRVFGALRLNNSFLNTLMTEHQQGKVVLSYENSIVFSKDGEVLRFFDITQEESKTLSVGMTLFEA